MIARVCAWYAWERNRRRVRAWSAAITVYVLVCVAEWPFTGIDPVTLHVVAYGGLVDTLRAWWDVLTTATGGVWS